MSVINKMLRDLEGRQQQVEVTDYVEKPAPKFMLLTTAAVALMILASAFTYGVVQLNADSGKHSDEIIEQSENATEDETPTIDIAKIAVAKIDNAKVDNNHTTESKDVAQSEAKINVVNSEVLERKEEKLSSKSAEGSSVTSVEAGYSDSLQIVDNSLRSSLNVHLEKIEPSISSEEKTTTATATTNNVQAENTFQVTSSEGHSLEVASLRESARLALDGGDKQRAINLLGRILELAPDENNARKQLASLLYAERDLAAALKILEYGVELQPDDSGMRLMQARIAFRLGDVTEAQNILQRHPSTTLISTELLSFRAALSEQNGNYRQAHSDYKALIAREPNTAKWWLGLAVSQDKLRLSNQALESYRRVQRLNQLSMQIHDFVKTRINSLTGQS